MVVWIDELQGVTPEIVYPESDGKPLAENTLQFQWIVTFHSNIVGMFHDRDDVFVASDLLWYPVEGHPEICAAPDVMVALGRPKGERRSYRQWAEEGVGPQVAFEIMSHTNTYHEMIDKLTYYEEHGVEEYYVYDPHSNRLQVYIRRNDMLRRVMKLDDFSSPLLGIRFDFSQGVMAILGPDGRRFLTSEEQMAERETLELLAAESEQRRAESEQRRAESEQRLATAEARMARLIELGRKARRGEASPDELRELDSLEDAAPAT